MRPVDSRLIRHRYWIVSTLASGGMGHTYRVWDLQQRIPAVIKIPRRDAQGGPDTGRRFVQELHAMLALQHEHIVPITDYGDDDDLPFVVMRFLPGGSLADYRDDRAGTQTGNPASMLHCWLPGVAAALDFMHQRSVLHRDVKPANIFLDAFLKPYLGDFGIAKALDDSARILRSEDLTADHIAVGTAAYMAPEQFRRGAPVTPRTDQYALAVTVYEMLSGKPPFQGDTEHIGVEHCTMAPPALDIDRLRIPPSLPAAVERALAKRPEERFADCGEFARAVLADLPPLRLSRDIARFLCPGCKTIIRLDVSRAGTAGTCMKCKKVLEIAKDLTALWLRDETSVAESRSRDKSAESARPRDKGGWFTRLMGHARLAFAAATGWLKSAGLATVLAAAIAGLLAWFANETHWRNRFASDLAESKNALARAEREITRLRLDLEAARAQASAGAAPRTRAGRRSLDAEPSPSAPLLEDEDDRGLPTAR
ncbi:MAG: serine/threonine-protein kinase [Planctomycetia bacterium]